jgi:23S rRNA (cytidine1920-2'-O)/16S rRNA (cytidine1409-2'-O)-methyltransferase
VRRRLDAELVRRGLAPSRSCAVEQIEAGHVTVAGAPARSAARLVDPAEPIALAGSPARFVSRGGEKLDAALDRFGLVVAGRRALDAGASTGGFTDCLLQRGAREVVAVDVGRGQLAWQLREDPRVRVLERTNLRHLDVGSIGDRVDVAVADLSFISLLLVAEPLAALTTRDAEIVLLVKPQFEAGRAQVGRGGVVRDARVHRDVLGHVVAGLGAHGLATIGAMPSPRRGADGNREFLVHVRKQGRTGSPPVPVSDADLDAAVAGSGEASERGPSGPALGGEA